MNVMSQEVKVIAGVVLSEDKIGKLARKGKVLSRFGLSSDGPYRHSYTDEKSAVKVINALPGKGGK